MFLLTACLYTTFLRRSRQLATRAAPSAASWKRERTVVAAVLVLPLLLLLLLLLYAGGEEERGEGDDARIIRSALPTSDNAPPTPSLPRPALTTAPDAADAAAAREVK